MNFSVLLSVYHKESPLNLRQSLDSVFQQTLSPSEVIIVEDGPLTPRLYSVLDEYADKYDTLKRIRLKKNQGLGSALNIGLKYCTNELVARMDTDDICYLDRFEKQIKLMNENPEIGMCGSWINEFIDSPENIVSQRRVPAEMNRIKDFIKRGCPFNHPTVVFKKSMVESAGGYMDFYLLEDWYLWARLIKNNVNMTNIQEPLLLFRTSEDMYKRRGGYKYAVSCLRLLKELKKMRLLNMTEYIIIGGSRFVVSIIPNWIRKYIYNLFRRMQH